MRRLAIVVCAVGVLMLGIASPASAKPSDPPNCFGLSAAALATSAPGALGEFVRSGIQQFNNPPDFTVGRQGVPFLKATCEL